MNYVLWPAAILWFSGECSLWAKAVGVVAALALAATADGSRGPKWLDVLGLAALAAWAVIAAPYCEYGFALYALAGMAGFMVLVSVALSLRAPVSALAQAMRRMVQRCPLRVRRAMERVAALAVPVGMVLGAKWLTRDVVGSEGALLGSWGPRFDRWTQWGVYISAGLVLSIILLDLFMSGGARPNGGSDVEG